MENSVQAPSALVATIPGDGNQVQVGVRIRPLNQRELDQRDSGSWTVKGNSISSSSASISTSYQYTFDHIFHESLNQDIYTRLAKNVILSCLEGVNGTLFAYGQTSSGKTHTMLGNPCDPGIIPLAVADIFSRIHATPSRVFSLRVSYLEIYNEIIRDLLNPENINLKIHENFNKEIFVGELTEKPVSSLADVEKVMAFGEANRSVGITNMNERSSRSHTIFRMVIESREIYRYDSHTLDDADKLPTPDQAVLKSTLNLVDLAGSERVASTGAEGQRLKEGGHINKSLLALTNVITKLADGDRTHIPYRNSKLTRILQPALGGNANTAIICTVTPASSFFEDTNSTLSFASRAKRITNRPEVNEFVSETEQLRRAKKKIQELERLLLSSTAPLPDISDKVTPSELDSRTLSFESFEEEPQVKRLSAPAELYDEHAQKKLCSRRQTWGGRALNIDQASPFSPEIRLSQNDEGKALITLPDVQPESVRPESYLGPGNRSPLIQVDCKSESHLGSSDSIKRDLIESCAALFDRIQPLNEQDIKLTYLILQALKASSQQELTIKNLEEARDVAEYKLALFEEKHVRHCDFFEAEATANACALSECLASATNELERLRSTHRPIQTSTDASVGNDPILLIDGTCNAVFEYLNAETGTELVLVKTQGTSTTTPSLLDQSLNTDLTMLNARPDNFSYLGDHFPENFAASIKEAVSVDASVQCDVVGDFSPQPDISELSTKVFTLETECQLLNSRILELELEADKLRVALFEGQAENARVSAERTDIQVLCDQLKSSNQNLMLEISELFDVKNNLIDLSTLSEERIDRLQKDRESLRSQLFLAEDELAANVSELALSHAVAELKFSSKIVKFEGQVAALQARLEEDASAKHAKQSQVETLELNLEASNHNVLQLQNSNDNLAINCQTLTMELDKLREAHQSELDFADACRQKLQASNSDLVSQIDALKVELVQLKDSRQSELALAEEMRSTLQESTRELKSKCLNLTVQLEQLKESHQSELALAENSRSKLHDSNQELENHCQTLVAKLLQLKESHGSELASIECRLSELQNHNNELEMHCQALKTELEQLRKSRQSEITLAESVHYENEEAKRLMESQLADLKVKISDLESMLEARTLESASLAQEFATLADSANVAKVEFKRETELLSETLAKKGNELSELRKELDDLSCKNLDLMKASKELKLGFVRMERKHQQALAEKEGKISELSAIPAAKDLECARMQEQLDLLNLEIAELKQHSSIMIQTVEELRAELATKDAELVSAQTSLTAASTEHRILLQRETSALKVELKNKLACIQELRKENDELARMVELKADSLDVDEVLEKVAIRDRELQEISRQMQLILRQREDYEVKYRHASKTLDELQTSMAQLQQERDTLYHHKMEGDSQRAVEKALFETQQQALLTKIKHLEEHHLRGKHNAESVDASNDVSGKENTLPKQVSTTSNRRRATPADANQREDCKQQ